MYKEDLALNYSQFCFIPIILSSCPLELYNTPNASLQRGKTPPPFNECPVYDTKLSDGEVPVILELPGQLYPGGSICGLNRTKLCTYAKLNCLE